MRIGAGILLVLAAMAAFAQIGPGNGEIDDLRYAADRAYFLSSPTDNHPGVKSVWETDGTPEGTRRLSPADLEAGSFAQREDGSIWFIGRPAAKTNVRWSLYEVDAAGTAHARVELDFTARQLVVWKDTLYFLEQDVDGVTNGTALWRSDGTPEGTKAVHRISSNQFFTLFAPPHGPLYLSGSSERLYALWRSDGTDAGTVRLHDHAYPVRFSRDYVFFSDADTFWRSDGTVSGTFVLGRGYLTDAMQLDEQIFLATTDGLWTTDGTAGGTKLVLPFGIPWPFLQLQRFGNRVALLDFRGSSSSLWLSDGTPLGTTYGIEIPAASLDDDFAHLNSAGDALYCVIAHWDPSPDTLFRTNGTRTGTVPIDAINAKKLRVIQRLGEVNGRLLFSAEDGVHGEEMWVSDFTPEGTRMLVNAQPESIVRGVVLDRVNAAPIEGATVSAGGVSTKTNAKGEYMLEVSANSWSVPISVRSPLHQRKQSSFSMAPEVVMNFSLDRGGRLSGRVTDVAGIPLANVSVLVASSTKGSTVAAALTRADGTWETDTGIPPNTPWLVYTNTRTAHVNQIYPNVTCATGCADTAGGTALTVAASETATGIDFALPAHGTIRGRLLDRTTGELATGIPIKVSVVPHDATPWYYRTVKEITTSTGQYEFTLPEGTYRIIAYAGSDLGGLWYPGDPVTDIYPFPWKIGTAIVPAPGQVTEGYDFVFSWPGVAIHGQVVDAKTGAPLAGVPVRAGSWWPVSTDHDGRYVTRPNNKAGTQQTISVQTTPPYIAQERTIVVSGNAVEQNFRIDRFASISGRITDAATGHPIAGAAVHVKAPSGTIVRSSSSDVSGQYTFIDLPDGTYSIASSASGWKDERSASRVDVALNSALSIDLALRSACSLDIPRSEAVVPANGDTIVFPVYGRCEWNATVAPVAFATAERNGESVKVRIAPNPTTERRTGTIGLPGRILTIVQEGSAPRRRRVG